MEAGFLNSLVADYLGSVSSKLAEKFKKETKSAPLPPDSPGIADMVKHFKETTPKVSKRKLAMTNGDSAAKKAKKDESSSDSDSDDDNKNKKPAAKAAAKAAPVEKMEESSDDSDSEDEKPAAKPAVKPAAAKKVAKKESSSEDSDSEDEKPAAKKATPAKPAPKAAAKKESSSDDSDSDEEEKPAAKAAPAKPAPKAAAKKEESSSDEDSSDEEEKPAAKAAPAKPAAKAAAKKEESSSDEDSSDEDEKPAAKAAPAKAAPKAAPKKEDSSSDEDSSDEEEAKPAAKKPAAKAAAKKEESSDEDSSDSDDEKPAPKAAKPAAKAAKKEESSDSDSSDSDDEPAPKKAAPAEPMDEDEPAMVVKSNKNKTLDDMKTPTKSHDQSYGGGDKSFSEEGRKIFIHNVGEETTYEDFQAAVEKHGEVTDFFNPGRGFGFITFSTNEEAQACIKAMDNTEIAGRIIQMNIARPKGEKPAPGTGGKRQEAPEGCKLFVHGITQETDNATLQSAFEAHGTVLDAYNPGKGFAFVTFSKPAEAKAAMEAFEGQEVAGCYVTINVAKPRGGGDTPGRGGRGGRGGGGGGGRREEIEGAKLFVHNVSEETSQEDIWNAFAEHGTVTDAYNPGRGFAFVTFGSAEDAKKAMDALEGQEVCGREIQCNVAKPREQKSDGGGRGGRGGARGGGRGRGGARGGGRGGMSISAGGGGGGNKKISFD